MILIEHLIQYISSSVERVLYQIDSDPLSSTFGCAHPAFWRDKTSDVADIRRQETVFPLALLYTNPYPHSNWQGSKKIIYAIKSLLTFWCKNQYADGSFDEWYKGERAYAAAAFSLHAVSRTLPLIETELDAELREMIRTSIRKTAEWLCKRNDLFKTNHQAVGVAALTFAGKLLNEDKWLLNAAEKLRSIMKVQTKEGWLPEINNMDVGYTFLTVEFVSMAMQTLNKWDSIDQFKRAYDFASEWVHPDCTVGEEYGICRNPYLSTIATVLLSQFSGKASWLRKKIFENNSINFSLSPLLADDLRLMRWAFQPLLAWDYSKIIPQSNSNLIPVPLTLANAENCFFSESKLFRFSCCGGTGVFSGASGGIVRLFNPKGTGTFTDFGYSIKVHKEYLTHLIYSRKIFMQELPENGIEAKFHFSLATKFMPSFISRVILRILCVHAITSKITRKFIDIYRRIKGTAINQSSGALKMKKSSYFLNRKIIFHKDKLVINDIIHSDKILKLQDIYSMESIDNQGTILSSIAEVSEKISSKTKSFSITKEYKFKNDKWSIKNIIVIPACPESPSHSRRFNKDSGQTGITYKESSRKTESLLEKCDT